MTSFASKVVGALRRAMDWLRRRRRGPAPPLPGLEAGAFDGPAGHRDYRLHVPPGPAARGRPLVVMLHGCTQDPEDFARGTRMNDRAGSRGALVLYPAQPARSNAAKCWNWFLPGDQHRGAGEPALLAAMTRHVADRHGADPDRIYVAGLSAGAAMAAVLAREYPDLFAACGVHSGLPAGAARDVPSAFAVMHTGRLRPGAATAGPPPGLPTIVFHGDKDRTVHPANGLHVVDAVAKPAGATGPSLRRGEAQGRPFTCALYHRPDGTALVEHWEVHGCGHAWSGGDPAGSYTDAAGPDASAEMVRFFLAHRRPPAAAGTTP